MYEAPYRHYTKYAAWLKATKGIEVDITDLDQQPQELIHEFYMEDVIEPHPPLARHPDREQLNRLGPGALVLIHCPAGTDDITFPLLVRLAKVKRHDFTYDIKLGTDDVMEQIPPTVYWDYTKLPEGRLPPESVRRSSHPGLSMCDGHWVLAIYDYGKYEPSPRNIYAHERTITGYNSRVRYRAFRRDPSVYGTGSISRGIYGGNLVVLAKEILSTHPSVVVPYEIWNDLFMEAYNKSGRPGYVGPIPKQPTCIDDYRVYRVTFGTGQYSARVNIKAFRKWVLKNAHRFCPTLAKHIAHRKEQYRLGRERDEVGFFETSFAPIGY
jgi:hypothetical protein